MKMAPSKHPFGFRLLGATAFALLSYTASAVDTLINIDFNGTGAAIGTYSGVGPAPFPGTTWNGLSVGSTSGALFPNYTSGALSSSTGGVTPVTISLGNFKVYSAGENPANLARALMTDFIYQQTVGPGGPNSSFSIRNLDLAATYDVYLLAQNGGYAGAQTLFNINGVSQTVVNAGNTVTSFTLGTNYVLYSGLLPDATGMIAGTFNSAKVADNAAFTGLQIVQHGGTPPPIPTAAATTISVDFNTAASASGTFSGAAVAPNAGTIWNGVAMGNGLVTSTTSGPLVATDGSTTPVTVTLGNYRAHDAGTQSLLAGALLTDFAYQPNLGNTGPDSTFSLGNLDPGSTYNLYLYAQNASVGSTATKFTIDGVSKTATDAGNIGTFIESTNYVLFSGLTPTAAGVIAGTFNCAKPGDNAAFNGFQLVQVPEPATVSFLAAGALALLRRQRSA